MVWLSLLTVQVTGTCPPHQISWEPIHQRYETPHSRLTADDHPDTFDVPSVENEKRFVQLMCSSKVAMLEL